MGRRDPLWLAPFGVGGVCELGLDVAIYFADFEAYIGPIWRLLDRALVVGAEGDTN